jgi:uncharacterized protein DUF6788
MNQHKNVLGGLSTAELRARRAALAARLPGAGAFLAGSLVEQHRRCGKEGCRCTQGELHGPYAYLQVAGRLVYVPATLAQTVRQHLQVSGLLAGLLEEISAVNLELLARRELD